MSEISEFFTPTGIGTMAGATSAIFVISSTYQHFTGKRPKWLSLTLSFLIGFMITFVDLQTGDFLPEKITPISVFLALLNSCLLFLTAVGVNTMAASRTTPAGPDIIGFNAGSEPKRNFMTAWF